MGNVASMNKTVRLLFAIAGGFAVGNLYFMQPLLGAISKDLGTTATQNGLLVTAIQLGYAAGIVLLLPMGDVRNRKHFVPLMVTLAGFGQMAVGLVPGFNLLLVTVFLVGFTTISGQVLVPLTSELSDDTNRGRNSAFVVSGMIIGILGARTISGVLSDVIGWHLTFVIIGVANLVLAYALFRVIPQLTPKPGIAYPRLVGGTFTLLWQNKWAWRAMIINSSALVIFSAVWTSITFLLSDAPFQQSTGQIGLWGLVGIVGAIGARNTGRLIDSGKAELGAKIAWVVTGVALVIGSLAEQSLWYLAAMLILLDAAGQAIGVTNQTRLIASFPSARSRVNAGYVMHNFIGAAAGSALASALWHTAGWSGIMLLGAGLCAVALVLWVLNRRTMPPVAAAK